MRTAQVVAPLVAILSLAAITSPTHAASPITHQITLPAAQSWCPDTMINDLLTQVNSLRVQNGRAALSMSTLGMKDAELRASQFAVYMETHVPGSPGFNPHEGYDTTAASLGYNLVSENLAFQSIDAFSIVYYYWQDSLHLAAMLARDANVAGVSCVFSKGVAYWTYEPGCSTSSCSSSTGGPVPTLDAEEWAFLTLINNFRAQNGVGPLTVSVALENASRWMSTDMATNNRASHTDSLGRDAGTRLAAFAYPYSPWGENIAGGYADSQSVFNGWLTACDPDGSGACTYAHRKNMLGSGFIAIGIARAYSASSVYGWYWTTDFGGYLDQGISPPGGGGSAPTVASFTATPSSIVPGQPVTLAWSVSGATAITIDNGVGAVTSAASVVVSPTQTTTYALTASNGAGSTTARATVTVTAAGDTQAPTVPTGLTGVAKSAAEIDLSWSPSTDNVGVAGYQILRNGAVIATVSGTIRTYADTSVVSNTTYAYAAKAFDAAGNFSAPSGTILVTTPAPVTTTNCPGPATEAFTGCYYNNIALNGTPSLVRTDPQINFDWYYAAPDPAVTRDAFSVRWQGNFGFGQGDYTFSLVVSDGMRVYIDGVLYMERWRDQASISYVFHAYMTAGTHLVTVEYYGRTGWPTAHVSWQKTTSGPAPPVISNFQASPASILAGQSTTLSWGVGGATTVTIDNGVGDVTALTSKAVSPTQTTSYTLTASNTGGSASARVTVSVSAASDVSPPTAPVLFAPAVKSASEVDLSWTPSVDNVGVAGYQVLRNGQAVGSVAGTSITYADTTVAPNTTYAYAVRAFDGAGNYSNPSNTGTATTPGAVTSSCPAPVTGAFTGCYFNNLTLAGTPAFSRTDSQVNFDWAYGAPAPGVTVNDFSVRWQGYFTFETATYLFTAMTSDGMRIYVDGNLVLDRWRDQGASTYNVRPMLTAGSHLITVEYYEHTGLPTAHLSWQKL